MSTWHNYIFLWFVNTFGHLDAHLVEHALDDVPLDDIEVLFIENVGNLICPADFNLGTHVRCVIISVTEGDDTAEKHPIWLLKFIM